MNPKDGKAGKPVGPAAPDTTEGADVADPGEMAEIKAEQIEKKQGKYGSTPAKPFKSSSEEGEGEEESVWIEIELVGEDDEPIPGESSEITLPDGSVARGTLDQNGHARVEGFEDGSCKISFPDLDKDAWAFIESAGPAGKS